MFRPVPTAEIGEISSAHRNQIRLAAELVPQPGIKSVQTATEALYAG